MLFAVGAALVVGFFAVTVLEHRQSHPSGSGASDTGVGYPVRPPGRERGGSNRKQALELYAPAAAFDPATTAADALRARAARDAATRRINSCQQPYSRQLFRGLRIGTSRYQVYRIYGSGLTLEFTQVGEAPVAREVATAEQAWATMALPNGKLRRVARALAAEIAASRSSPRIDGCTFLHQLAAHRFSLAWAEHSDYARASNRFTRETTKPSYDVSFGFHYVLLENHLLTDRQWQAIVSFPGIQG